MDGYALIEEWPTLCRANAETVFASPAWRMDTEFNGDSATLTKAGASEIESPLRVELSVDGVSNVLEIGDSELFPDLHRLWGRLAALPSEVTLALVEKECGGLFQMLENVLRLQLAVKGLADAGDASPRRKVFFLSTEEGEVLFSLDVSSALALTLGKLRYLDPGHESIRSLRRAAWAEHATLDLSDDESAALAVGDRILIPEDARAAWRVSSSEDDLTHLRAETPAEVTFAQMADDDWPTVPEPETLVLTRNGKPLAKGTCVRLGLQKAFKVEELIRV